MKKAVLAVSVFLVFGVTSRAMEAQQCAKTGCNPASYMMAPQQFSVTGCGKVPCSIDLVDIRFSVSVRDSDAESSKKKQDKIVVKVNKYLREKGFPDGILSLQNSSLQRQKIASGKPDDDFYLAQSVYLLRTDRVQDTNALQVELVETGVDEIQSVTFLSSKQCQLEDEARKLALKDATERADLTAKALGLKLGKPVNVYYETPFTTADNFIEVMVRVTFSYE